MKSFILISVLVSIVMISSAQPSNSFVERGNDAYKRGDYKTATTQYQHALQLDTGNNIAKFNLGNAFQKQNNSLAAEKQYNDFLTGAQETTFMKADAFYNKGLSLIKQKKITEAISAFKQSLKLAPQDDDTRENLQKAINELRRQQQQQQSNKQQDKQNNQKKPSQSKQPDQQMMEQKFNELRNQEKELQKMLQKKTTNNQPDKDW